MSDDSIRGLVAAIRKSAKQTLAQCDDLTDLLNHLSIDTSRRNPHTCPECGIVGKSARAIAEHRYYTHGCEEPAHFALIEARNKLYEDHTP